MWELRQGVPLQTAFFSLPKFDLKSCLELCAGKFSLLRRKVWQKIVNLGTDFLNTDDFGTIGFIIAKLRRRPRALNDTLASALEFRTNTVSISICIVC